MKHARWLGASLTALLVACGGGGAATTSPSSPNAASRGEVLSTFPKTPDPDRRYIIYLHNLWLENQGPGVPHPTFGDYAFDEILRALVEPGITVIGEVRPQGADPHAAARRVADQVANLQSAGVPAGRITVVGFSKGGAIAILASALVADDSVNFVFIAACGSWIDSTPSIVPRGRLLSIRESSDDMVGTCDHLFARAPPSTESDEIVVSLGGGHGAFFTPRAEWVRPVISWATTDDPQ